MYILLFFLFYFYSTSSTLRGNRLDVVLVEVALEVEVGQLLALRDAEELLERGIRLDVVLVLQVVLLDVVVHRLRDLRAGHQGALRLREEVAELLRDLRGALEDGRGTLDLNAVLVNLDAALALARILDLAVHALLQALDLAEERGNRLAHRGEVARDRLDVLLERRDRRRGGRRLSGRRRDRRNDNRRRDNGNLGLGGLGLHDLLLSGRRRHQGRQRRGGNRRRGRLLLRNNLLSNDLRSGGTHHTGSRGILHINFTHYLISRQKSASIFRGFFEVC